MNSSLLLAVALGAVGLLASCGAGGGEEAAADPAPQQGFQMKSGDLFDDDSQKIVDRYGAANPMFDKTGQRKAAGENTMVNQQFTGDFHGQRYKGNLKDYEKRSFWGRKDYASQVYDGDTGGGDRFLKSARESASGARENSMVSREHGQALETGSVARRVAREGRGGELSKPSDAETDYRRRVYQEPEVKSLRQKRALDVEETRAMLGR